MAHAIQRKEIMNYKLFTEALLQELISALSPDVIPTIENHSKNGDPANDLIVFKPKELSKTIVYPVVSAKQCYDYYKSTGDISKVVSEVLYTMEHSKNLTGITAESFTHYENVKDRICLKLMNYSQNRELLEDSPHIRYYDLALICIYLSEKVDDSGMQSLPVRNDLLKLWGISEKDLLKQAIENAPKIMQPQIFPMENILSEIPHFPARSSRNNMYILTNKERFLGSVCMTFPGVLADFADQMNSDLIILPSSTHEVILVPDDGSIFKDINEYNPVIQSANKNIVDPVDRLSDHYYRFVRKTMKLEY